MKLALLAFLAFEGVSQAMAALGLIQHENGKCWYVKQSMNGGKLGLTTCDMGDPSQIFNWSHDSFINWASGSTPGSTVYCVDGHDHGGVIHLYLDCQKQYPQQLWYFDDTSNYSKLHAKHDNNAFCAKMNGADLDTDVCDNGERFKFISYTSAPTPAPTPAPLVDVCHYSDGGVDKVRVYADEKIPADCFYPGTNGYDENCVKKPEPSSSGDPHFRTWGGELFDFHGGCDLVLLQIRNFANGLGLEVHIRTVIDTWWSYIETAAVKLGDDILEITGGKKHITYWLNGVEVADMETRDAALGDYAVRFKRHSEHQSQTRIDLGNGNALSIESYKRFVRVNVKVNDAEKFAGSVGMLGSYPDGKRLARDKATPIEDVNEFGMEWQVLATEPKLFHNESAVQHPMKCLMPDVTKKSQSRRLGESMITEEMAAEACARVPEHDRDPCIFDVMATQDKDMAGSY